MRRFFFEELSNKLALHTFNSQKYVYVYVPSRDLTLLEDRIEHVTSKRMLSRYQPICVRCKQTHTSLKIKPNDNDKGCIAS